MQTQTYETLVQRYRRRLLIFATRWLGEPAMAEDVAQEALRRVYEAIQERRIDDMAALPAYLYQTARHVCLQHSRKRQRENRAFTRLAAEPAANDPFNPFLAVVSSERRRQVRRALTTLSVDDRNLLSLFFHAGLDAKEVASRSGVTAATARVRKHRALRRLEAALDADETFARDREPDTL